MAAALNCAAASHCVAGDFALYLKISVVLNPSVVGQGRALRDGQARPRGNIQRLVCGNGQVLPQFHTAVHGANAVFKDDAAFFININFNCCVVFYAADWLTVIPNRTSHIGADNRVAVDGDSGRYDGVSFREDTIAALRSCRSCRSCTACGRNGAATDVDLYVVTS